MARDWRFQPAEFRGARFYVDTATPSGGRRKAVHQYPGSEFWDVEDLGTKAKRVSFTAYVVSETADADYAALIAACDQPGPSDLSLPFFGVVTASAETWDPRWSQEKLQYVGGDFAFILENPAGAPVAIGLGERLLAGFLAGASAVLGGAVSALFAGVPATSWQRADAGGYLADTSAFVETIRSASAIAVPDATSVAAGLALDALMPIPSAETDPGAFVASALDALDLLVIDADPDDAAPILRTAAALALTMVPTGLIDQADLGQAAAAIPVALATATTMQAIRLTATATYTDRSAAITARDTIQAMAVAILPIVGALGADPATLFADLWGQAVVTLSQVITDLAPVRLLRINVALPSTALAYRLYGDPARGAELVARNKVATPLIMPTLFEAASS